MSEILKGNFWDAFCDNYVAEHPDKTKEHKLKIAMQAFLYEPKIKLKSKIQAQNHGVTVSTDFSQITKDSFNVTLQTDNFDMGYEQAFKTVPVAKGQDQWEIYDVSNSVNFGQIQEGQRLDVAGMEGSLTRGTVHYYGGAIGWTDAWIRFRKVAAMIDKAEIFRNKFWSNKANNFYSLLAAAAALNVTPTRGEAGDGQTRQDVRTINRAVFVLTNRLKDKGYGNMANAPVIMYANPNDEERIEAAFRATTNALLAIANRGEQITARRVTRIYTYNSNIVSGFPIVVVPGNKIQKAEVMAPTTYNQEQDILTLNRVQAVWAIYGGIIADSDQVETITLA